jgi:hypothetical protein
LGRIRSIGQSEKEWSGGYGKLSSFAAVKWLDAEGRRKNISVNRREKKDGFTQMDAFVILIFQFFISDIITPPRLRRYSSYLKRRVVVGNIWVSGRKFRKKMGSRR